MSAEQVMQEPFDSALAYAFGQKPIHLIELSMRDLSYAIRSAFCRSQFGLAGRHNTEICLPLPVIDWLIQLKARMVDKVSRSDHP